MRSSRHKHLDKNEKRISRINRSGAEYPALLKEIANPPSVIIVRGSLPRPRMPCIAIVGTRRATSKGMLCARKISRELSLRGAAIISGLALGIDAAAHEGALEAGGITAAVLPVGIDRVYPRQNVPLAEKIVLGGGALITEYENGGQAFPGRFLERNRIISGMSIATVVVEAPRDSGALVTARTAAEAGRDVFVLPGPSDHPNYAGSHALIRDGARLARTTEDIVEDIAEWLKDYPLDTINIGKSGNETAESYSERKIVSALSSAGKPLSADEIIEAAELDIQVLHVALSTLILKEIIIENSGGMYELGHR